MILLDVNVMVYAYVGHEEGRYGQWLQALVNSRPFAVCDITVSGFLRVVTSRRMLVEPSNVHSALAFVETVCSSSYCQWLSSGGETLATFRELVESDSQIQGKMIPDAWLASIALSNGCVVATADRGFARYRGLHSFDPLSERE